MDGEDGADVDGSNQRNVEWVGYRADLIRITNWHLNSL